MAFISTREIIDIVIMSFAIGYIFSGMFRREPTEGYDPLKFYQRSGLWEDVKYATMIAAPSVVLHELAHKFVAMSFGATATLHAPYTLYAIVIIMKMLSFPFIFFVGGYVSHSPLPALPSAFVAVAGPLTNLILWLIGISLVKSRLVARKYYRNIMLMAKLNLFLFAFNMIPIPGFDGYHFFMNLISLF